jgi:hypothetical protein
MKKLVLVLLLASCTNKENLYKIEGTVETKEGPHPAIWYTDTISFDGDTVYYFNSDSSEVRISPPYVIKQGTYNIVKTK